MITIEKDNINKHLHEAISLYENFQKNGDIERVHKAENLIQKLNNEELIVAFSGHFSAGKSTMINHLIGEQILPSSPIPTSANLVRVRQAEDDFAMVHYSDEPPLLFEGSYDFDTIKKFCMQGDVREVEIGQTNASIPKGITVMDTPGVDSTDDAHRIATESAIHLADIVFYVMDYNHVQSELNFIYTKELLDHGVQLYLIINQIDKHNNNEILFEDFQQSVKASFESWNVKPANIFYTTLKEPEHPNNQYDEVKTLVQSVLHQQKQWLASTHQAAVKRLTAEHDQWLLEQKEMEAVPFQEMLTHYTDEEKAKIFQKEEYLSNQQQEITNNVTHWRKKFEKEREAILTSAYLMPFKVRELAEKFLESMQPDFKVGRFFWKKKTVAERETRLQTFYEQLQKQVESQLEWHMKQFLTHQLEEADVFQSELVATVQSFSVPMKKDLLKRAIKKGARMSGQYVLNYCEEVRNELIKLAVLETDQLKEAVIQILKERALHQSTALKRERTEIKKAADALRSLQEIKTIWQKKKQNVTAQVSEPEKVLAKLQAEWVYKEENVRIYSEKQEEQVSVPTEMNKEVEARQTEEAIQREENLSIEHTVETIKEAHSLLHGMQGFQRMLKHLQLKADRLQEKKFTVSLFGAFSAGKSSFANALLGEKVLPVSPNPTTAAINRICPPDEQYEHGTAAVHLKAEKEMLADVSQALDMFTVSCESLQDAYEKIPAVVKSNKGEGKEKVQLAFLRAFQQGYPHYKKELGSTIMTDLEQFRGFVANESQSCFVESIDLYYDCALTQKGITLVDTPGADSINARHTGVAFEYIKNSDAILFVTYYNHAFSKADREFLIQLGRVKDAFELDKMFFIVNAIDLASSQAEVEKVKEYVREQLVAYGIRFPRIFGLSSKLALEKETREASNIPLFIQSFNQFLDNDLTRMAVQSAQQELKRLFIMLNNFISTALESKEQKEEKREKLKSQQKQMLTRLQQMKVTHLVASMIQEQQELLFYVKQRVFYRFSDFFKEAFHPSVLKNNHKQNLTKALDELLGAFGFDFAQEMRATSLRVEKFIRKSLTKQFEQIEKEMGHIQEQLTFTHFEPSKMETIAFAPAFTEIDRMPLEKTFKYFKNPKAFFERNEKKMMEEELKQLLSPLADDYLQQQQERLQEHYEAILIEQFTRMIDGMIADCEEQFGSWLDVLMNTERLEDWMHARDVLKEKIAH